MFEGKPKRFKNWPNYAKHAIFATGLSHKQVTRTLKTKILKNFLSFFRDWKFYLRGSHEVSCENLWVPLATGTFTREQVANLSRKKHKNPNFEKFSKYFLWLGHWPANELWKIFEWACDWGMWLDQPTTELPEQSNTVFEILTFFVKTKYFPKTTKTLKNLFMIDHESSNTCKNTFERLDPQNTT